MKKRTITTNIDYDLYLELVKLREQIGVPVVEAIRRAVREYVDKHQQEQKPDDGEAHAKHDPKSL